MVAVVGCQPTHPALIDRSYDAVPGFVLAACLDVPLLGLHQRLQFSAFSKHLGRRRRYLAPVDARGHGQG